MTAAERDRREGEGGREREDKIENVKYALVSSKTKHGLYGLQVYNNNKREAKLYSTPYSHIIQ